MTPRSNNSSATRAANLASLIVADSLWPIDGFYRSIITLVIISRNRREKLLRTLESLKKLRTRLTWELIVVDNGSTDGTGIAVEAFAAASEKPVRLIYETAPGEGNARNAAGNQQRLKSSHILMTIAILRRIIWTR